MSQALAGIWHQRQDRYSQLRAAQVGPATEPRVEMHYIGG
jgi:cyclic pyranopterin phosphate synthase